MVLFPYNTTDFAFTLNDVFIEFISENEDTYFNMLITIEYYDFFSSNKKTKVRETKIPLFNNRQKINVGRVIHRYLSNLNTYSNKSGFQYKTATVSFNITELNVLHNTIVDTVTLSNVKFIAGPKPKILKNNIGLLSLNTDLERLPLSSFFNFSFLLSNKNHVLEIYQNNLLKASQVITASNSNSVYIKTIKPEDFSASIGDVFKLKIKDTDVQKEVVVSEKGLQLNQIVFLDVFKLPKCFCFTGGFVFKNKYNQITHNYKRNLNEVLEVIQTEKIKTFIVNTGNILNTERDVVDELNDSKKAFLVANNNTVLNLVPIADKLDVYNSEDENQSFNVNFQINKEHA